MSGTTTAKIDQTDNGKTVVSDDGRLEESVNVQAIVRQRPTTKLLQSGNAAGLFLRILNRRMRSPVLPVQVANCVFVEAAQYVTVTAACGAEEA